MCWCVCVCVFHDSAAPKHFCMWLTTVPAVGWSLAGTPAQRKRLVLASLSGVLGSLYVVGLCVMMAKHPNMSPFSMLSKL